MAEGEDWEVELPGPKKISTSKTDEVIPCLVGGVQVAFVIDSGSPINAITEKDWERLRELEAPMEDVREGNGRRFQAYASHAPLEILHTFRARISVNDEKPQDVSEFLVVANEKKELCCHARPRKD